MQTSTEPHRTAAILAIGDELVIGQKLDTNSRWLSRRLIDLGIRPIEHATLDDDVHAISAALERLAERADLIISTGGLGPTADDLTRASLALAMGESLIEDSVALEQIKAWYASRGRPMPPANRVQARRPPSARRLPNTRGTAPGLAGVLEVDHPAPPEGADRLRADVYCLPGPPIELRAMFEDLVLPELRPPTDAAIVTRVLHTFGLGESDVADRLGTLMARDRAPTVGTTASEGVVSVRIRYEGPSDHDTAARLVDETASLVRDQLGDVIFAVGEDATLESAMLDRLRARAETLAVVESCTGGLLAELLTSIPGSSDAFVGGWITYTNRMKHEQVGVPMSTFRAPSDAGEPAPGAVSRECAAAMAVGGLERSGSDHCLAITGIAGPDGDTPDKPVGTVWIALASSGGAGTPSTDVRRFLFKGGRDQIRLWSARSALGLLRLRLDGLDAPLLAESGS